MMLNQISQRRFQTAVLTAYARRLHTRPPLMKMFASLLTTMLGRWRLMPSIAAMVAMLAANLAMMLNQISQRRFQTAVLTAYARRLHTRPPLMEMFASLLTTMLGRC